MAGISKINYKGREIFHFDGKGLNDTQIIALIKTAEKDILKENKPKLFLVDVTGNLISQKFIQAAINMGDKVKHLSQRSAIVGLSESDDILLRGFNAIINGEMRAFNTTEDALEYLVG